MLVNRSLIATLAFEYFLAMYLVFLTTNVDEVRGRKCVCTSKACKEQGVDTCETNASCYTERRLTGGLKSDKNTTTRGCTPDAQPLLCEAKSWVRIRKSGKEKNLRLASRIGMPGIKLKCCNSHDYCNARGQVKASTQIPEKDKTDPLESTTIHSGLQDGVSDDVSSRVAKEPNQSNREPIVGDRESLNQLEHRVRPLHFATLLLAISALISVLAACYVITRFLNSNSYVAGNIE